MATVLAHLPLAPGLLAFLFWCVTDTDLKPKFVTNSEGRITLWQVLTTIFVQMGLWVIVFFLAGHAVRHFPRFLVTGWRLPLVEFGASFWQWMALLMILQYAWTVLRATSSTAVVAVMARLGSPWALDSLDRGHASFKQMERKGRQAMQEPQDQGSTATKGSEDSN